MNISNIVLSITIPFIIWLFYGMPDLSIYGNLILFATVIFHLLVTVWINFLFRLFRGDVYTYGMVTASLNGLSFFVNFSIGFFTFFTFRNDITLPSVVSPITWSFMLLSMLGTLIIPLLTSQDDSTLPQKANRRKYVVPENDK